MQMENIKDEKFIERIRALITDGSTHNASYYNITPSVDRFGTTHVSVLAADGTAVSVTSTINQMWDTITAHAQQRSWLCFKI